MRREIRQPDPGPVNRQTYREWLEEQAETRFILNADLTELADYLGITEEIEAEEKRERNRARVESEFKKGYLEAERRERRFRSYIRK